MDYLEQLADVVEINLVGLGRDRAQLNLTMSPAFQGIFLPLHKVVSESLESVLLALSTGDINLARHVLDRKTEVNNILSSEAIQKLRTQTTEDPTRLESYAIEKDILEKTKRLFYFIRRLARTQTRHKKHKKT